MNSGEKILQFLSILLFSAIVCSCSVQQNGTYYKKQLTEQAELSFFLQPLPQEMLPLSFTISAINLIPEQGEAISLLNSAVEIKGSELVGVQKRLASKIVPPGRYKGVSLTIDKAAVSSEAGETALLSPAGQMRIELKFSLTRASSHALFLFLSPEYLITDGFRFTPRFVLGRPNLPARNFLGYISNSEENSFTVFNKITMEVVELVHTGVGPKGMALDQNKGILYVAAAGDDTIEVYSSSSLQLVGRIRLHGGDEPTQLALVPDGRTLMSINYGSATVSIIDTRSMFERRRLSINPDPVWAIAGKGGQRAYVLHTMSSTVSVVDLSGRNSFNSISLAESPIRGALGGNGDMLYILSQYATDLLVFDVNSYQVVDRVFIGTGCTSLTVDPRSNQVYVGKDTGEIVVVDPASGMFIDSFQAGPNPDFMIIEEEQNVLFVLSTEERMLQKFNLVSKRKRAAMETGEKGHTMAVMGEL